MSVAILGIMTTQEHPSIRMIQLHADAAGGVAVATGINEVNPVKAGRVTSTLSSLAQVAFVYHVFHLHVGFAEVDTAVTLL